MVVSERPTWQDMLPDRKKRQRKRQRSANGSPSSQLLLVHGWIGNSGAESPVNLSKTTYCYHVHVFFCMLFILVHVR